MTPVALMARFNAWVNGHIYGVAAGLPKEAYRAERDVFFGSIHHTLNHLLVVDRLWMGRLQGTPHGIATLRDVLYDDFPALRAARQAEDERLVQLVDGLSPAQLEEQVTWTLTSGKGTGTTRRDHMLLTLYNHQTHHRGQVTAMFTQAGAPYPDLDLPYYLREQGLA